MARSQKGSKTFRCPGEDCKNEFLLADLYGNINPDLYAELLLAMDKEDDLAFFDELHRLTVSSQCTKQ